MVGAEKNLTKPSPPGPRSLQGLGLGKQKIASLLTFCAFKKSTRPSFLIFSWQVNNRNQIFLRQFSPTEILNISLLPQLLYLTRYHRKRGKGSIDTLSSLISNLFMNGKLLFLYLFLPCPRLVLSSAESHDDLELRSRRCRKLEIGSIPTLKT